MRRWGFGGAQRAVRRLIPPSMVARPSSSSSAFDSGGGGGGPENSDANNVISSSSGGVENDGDDGGIGAAANDGGSNDGGSNGETTGEPKNDGDDGGSAASSRPLQRRSVPPPPPPPPQRTRWTGQQLTEEERQLNERYGFAEGFNVRSEKNAIGANGERHVYNEYRQKLSGFDAGCWLSRNRACVPGLARLEQESACDFVWLDERGALGGRPGAFCFIEVKSTQADMPGVLKGDRLSFSLAQLELAVKYSDPVDEHAPVFVLVRVADAGLGGKPVIAYTIVDPIKKIKEGGIREGRLSIEIILMPRPLL